MSKKNKYYISTPDDINNSIHNKIHFMNINEEINIIDFMNDIKKYNIKNCDAECMRIFKEYETKGELFVGNGILKKLK
jgi:hypothetical protein